LPSPANKLLLDRLNLSNTDRVLIFSAVDLDFILTIARRAGSVIVYDISYAALRKARLLAEKTTNITVSDEVYSPEVETFDAAVIFAPKGRDFARAQLWNAMTALRPGGQVYVVGANDSGVKSVISDMEDLFGNVTTLGYKSHQRAASAERPVTQPPYPWGDVPTEMQTRTIQTPLGHIPVATMPGVFSWQALDPGTAFLLKYVNMRFKPTHTILDMGCGYGILGILAAKTAGSVTMVDDNLLAVRCARETIKLNNAENVIVMASDVYSDLSQRQFDVILCNPPFHKEFDVNTNVAQRIINEARTYLRRSGRLIMVANAFLKYQQTMRDAFPKVDILGHDGRFIVIEGKAGNRPQNDEDLDEIIEAPLKDEEKITDLDREALRLKGFDPDEIELLMSVDDDEDDDDFDWEEDDDDDDEDFEDDEDEDFEDEN
jgi:16S rRNA (guanine1207-N2)-methyltransferase